MAQQVFISHSGADSTQAAAVADVLTGSGIEVRLDRKELALGDSFLSFMEEVHDDLRRDVESDRWFQGRESPLRSVAYFSPEFGIAEALPQYSGGLGVLAGDHLKAASGLGVPLMGVCGSGPRARRC